MPRKKTSPQVSTVAGRVLASDIEAQARQALSGALSIALQECGLPINARTTATIVDRLADSLKPTFDDLRTLAGSSLTQDETAGNVEADE